MSLKLTKLERAVLINQYLVLEKLYPQEADHYAKLRKSLENGWALHYDDVVQWLSDDMSEDLCREVRDILEMFRVLHFAWKKLEPKGIEQSEIRFQGFDGNNEPEQMSYAQWLLEQGLWEESHRKTHEYNSHAQMLHVYRRMLSAWTESANKYEPTLADMHRIVAARVHPEHRPPADTSHH